MTPEQREELAACPFCGDVDSQLIEHVEGTIIHPAYFVKCDNCGAVGPTTDKGNHRELWSRRAKVEALTVQKVEVPEDYLSGPVLTNEWDIAYALGWNNCCDAHLAAPTIPAIPGTKEE